MDLFLGDGGSTGSDLLVGQCLESTSCPLIGGSWSLTFSASDITVLSSFAGPLVLTAVKMGPTFIRLGSTTLNATIPEAALPVPSLGPVALAMLLGLLGTGGWQSLRARAAYASG